MGPTGFMVSLGDPQYGPDARIRVPDVAMRARPFTLDGRVVLVGLAELDFDGAAAFGAREGQVERVRHGTDLPRWTSRENLSDKTVTSGPVPGPGRHADSRPGRQAGRTAGLRCRAW